jgi:predicted RNase H-like HicB family nuclease
MKYLVVVEPTPTGFSAFSPDVPGCVATAPTREAVEHEIAEAISFHLDGLRAEGLPVPQPHTQSTYVDVSA